jgi:outer membrane protein TolC
LIKVFCAVLLSVSGLFGQKKSPEKAPEKLLANPSKVQSKKASRKKVLLPTDQRSGCHLRLGLKQCFELGVFENRDLAVSRLDTLIAEQDFDRTRAAFDPSFYAEGTWTRSESPSRSTFQPSSRSKTYNLSIGARKTFDTGGTLDLAFSPGYIEQKVNSPFAFPSTFFFGEIKLSVSQPLLKGAWGDSVLGEYRRAKLEIRASKRDFQRRVQTVLQQIAEAYYGLVFVREDFRVKFQSLEISREQLRRTERKIRLGELATKDKVADQADVARKEEELILAENAILENEDQLKRLILPFREVSDWEVVLIPSEELGDTDSTLILPPFSQALEKARQTRADLLAGKDRVAKAVLQEKKARWDLFPKLDLSGSVSSDAIRDDTAKYQKDVFGFEFPDYSLKLAFEIPIGNLAAKASFRKARIELEKARRNLRVLEIDLAKDLRKVFRTIRAQKKTIDAAKHSVDLAQANLETEKIRLNLDSTTPFEVQRRNQELSDARSRWLKARLDYRSSWFQLQSILGTLTPKSLLPMSRAMQGEGIKPN